MGWFRKREKRKDPGKGIEVAILSSQHLIFATGKRPEGERGVFDFVNPGSEPGVLSMTKGTRKMFVVVEPSGAEPPSEPKEYWAYAIQTLIDKGEVPESILSAGQVYVKPGKNGAGQMVFLVSMNEPPWLLLEGGMQETG